MDVDCMKDGLAKKNPASWKIPLDVTAIDASEKPMGFSLDAQMQDKALGKSRNHHKRLPKKLVKKLASKSRCQTISSQTVGIHSCGKRR